MKTTTLLRIAIASSALFVSTAHAQLFRSYLTADGNDGNPCTLQAPCRLLPAALNAVASGGEIWMLDSANYNTSTVTISKSVSILAIPGALGSIVGNGGDAIVIDTAGVKVTLRNLKILNFNGGQHGIFMTNGAALKVENCEIAGFSQSGYAGIRVMPPAAAEVTIVDTLVRDNWHGIYFDGGTKGTVARATVVGNADTGILAAPYFDNLPLTVTVTDSVSSNNKWGFWAISNSALRVAKMTVSRSSAANNGASGFQATGPAALMVVSGSVASNNVYGFYQDGSTFRSLGDNTVLGNTVNDVIGTITPTAPI